MTAEGLYEAVRERTEELTEECEHYDSLDVVYEVAKMLHKDGVITDQQLVKFYLACFDPDTEEKL